jgi:hypothetical protein
MAAEVLLVRKRDEIVQAWLEAVLRTYPEQTSRFLLEEADPFRNPVGRILRQGIPALFDSLVDGSPPEIRSATEEIIRLRAVQDLTPGQALGFLHLLKPVLRGALTPEIIARLEERIDEAARIAFDVWLDCRRQIGEIQARERKRRIYVLERIQGHGGAGPQPARSDETVRPTPSLELTFRSVQSPR